MQIHELTEAGLMQRLKQGAKNLAQSPAVTPQGLQQARSDNYGSQAAKAAQKLQAQGYKVAAPGTGVTPGQPMKVTATVGGVSANYVKTATGWQNELGQPVTNPQSVTYLDQLLAQQQGAQPATPSANRPGGAIMTTAEVNQAIRQLGLSQQQLNAFQAQASQNPGFVRAFLKRLGLVQ
jgi:hypothetical protein